MSGTTLTNPQQLSEVSPGDRGLFRIPVALRSSGEQLSIAVHVLRGRSAGPTLGVIGGVHGDAVFGTHMVRTIVQNVDPDQLHGTIVGVPVANPIAFESGTRTTGQGWNTDMNNMNRVFPGTKDGWVTQQMAYALSSCVFPALDAVIDYHCSNEASINYALVNGDKTEDQVKNYRFARLMGTDFVYIHDADPFSGTIDQELRQRGKLCVIAEQGGAELPDGFSDLALQRVVNYLKALGMMSGEPVLPDRQLVMRGGRSLPRIQSGGVFYPDLGIAALSTLVPGGTQLGHVVDPHTFEVVQRFIAPYEQSAILSCRPAVGRVNPGDYAYIIGDGTTGTYVDRLQDWRIEL
jgi:predicted deacylase